MTDNADYLSIEPWPVQELAGQLVAHATLGRRALLERGDEADPFERETDRFELDAWSRLELTPWLTATELDAIGQQTGSLNDEQLVICERALIIASTIGWSLHIVTQALPASSNGDAELLTLDWAPTPWTPVRQVFKRLQVRSEEDLGRERERWEVLVWRLSLFDDPEYFDDDSAALAETLPEIEEAHLWRTNVEDILINVESDLIEVGKLSDEALEALREDAETRLRTMNWVCGYGERPSTAPLELEPDSLITE